MRTFINIEEIRAERAQMRDNRVIFNLLGVLMGELDRHPSQNDPVTPDDIYKNIKKLYEAAIECGNDSERDYLEQFIRKQLTEKELLLIIRRAIDEGAKNIGDVMKWLKTNIPGQYDGNMASQLTRTYLSKK